jgi:hypothetical protein
MTKARFQADADLRQAIVTGVIRRQPNLDFRSANEAGLEGLKDPEVLALAARDGRVLVTHDRKTMPTEFGQFIMSQASSGVLTAVFMYLDHTQVFCISSFATAVASSRETRPTHCLVFASLREANSSFILYTSYFR